MSLTFSFLKQTTSLTFSFLKQTTIFFYCKFTAPVVTFLIFTVTWKNGGSDTYDTIFAAIGRKADTSKLGLKKAGAKINDYNGKILCQNEQTNVSHIYAIGDVVQDVPELTPVAIQSGRMLGKFVWKYLKS